MQFGGGVDLNTWFFLFIAFMVFMIYGRGPIRLKNSLWVDPKPMPMLEPPAIEDWPVVAEFFEQGEQFESLGFQKEELIVIDDMMPNTIFFVQPYRNFEEVSLGVLNIALSQINNTWRVSETKVGIDTIFSDESSVSTFFTNVKDILEPIEDQRDFLVTWTKDPTELHKIHGRLVDHFARNQQRVDYAGDEYGRDISLAFVKKTWQQWERYRDAGYFYLEQGEAPPQEGAVKAPINPYATPTVSPQVDRFLLTYKGAYILTWSVLFPLKQIRRWAAGRKTKRVLRRC